MEFLGIGLPELLMILLIALLVVGPQRLPEVAAQIARFLREARAYSAGITREITEALEDLQREAQETKGELKAASDEWKEVGEGLRSSTSEISESLKGARSEAETGKPAAPTTLLPPPSGVATDGHTAPAPEEKDRPS